MCVGIRMSHLLSYKGKGKHRTAYMKKGSTHRKRKILISDPDERKRKIEAYRERLRDSSYIDYAIEKIAIDLTLLLTK